MDEDDDFQEGEGDNMGTQKERKEMDGMKEHSFKVGVDEEKRGMGGEKELLRGEEEKKVEVQHAKNQEITEEEAGKAFSPKRRGNELVVRREGKSTLLSNNSLKEAFGHAYVSDGGAESGDELTDIEEESESDGYSSDLGTPLNEYHKIKGLDKIVEGKSEENRQDSKGGSNEDSKELNEDGSSRRGLFDEEEMHKLEADMENANKVKDENIVYEKLPAMEMAR